MSIKTDLAPFPGTTSYHSIGPGRLETTDIHVSDRWFQTNLDDPEILSD